MVGVDADGDDGSTPPPPDQPPPPSGSSGEPAPGEWWLEPGEAVLHLSYASALYQNLLNVGDDSATPNLLGNLRPPVRRRFRARFHVTDRRLVAVRGRQPSRRRRPLPVDVTRDRLTGIDVVSVLGSRGAGSRAWPGRRYLRMEIDLEPRHLLLGISLPSAEAEVWAATLTDRA